MANTIDFNMHELVNTNTTDDYGLVDLFNVDDIPEDDIAFRTATEDALNYLEEDIDPDLMAFPTQDDDLNDLGELFNDATAEDFEEATEVPATPQKKPRKKRATKKEMAERRAAKIKGKANRASLLFGRVKGDRSVWDFKRKNGMYKRNPNAPSTIKAKTGGYYKPKFGPKKNPDAKPKRNANRGSQKMPPGTYSKANGYKRVRDLNKVVKPRFKTAPIPKKDLPLMLHAYHKKYGFLDTEYQKLYVGDNNKFYVMYENNFYELRVLEHYYPKIYFNQVYYKVDDFEKFTDFREA